MRRILIITLILTAFTLTQTDSFGAESKEINILAALGLMTEGFKDPAVDVGIEFQLNGVFYVQFLANTYLGSNRAPDYMGIGGGTHISGSPLYYGSGAGITLGNTLYGLNAYGLFKFPVTKRTSLFTKAGLNITFYESHYYNDRASDKYGLGFAAGTGLEYHLNHKFTVMAGTTYKHLFVQAYVPGSDGKLQSWFKFYTGVRFNLK